MGGRRCGSPYAMQAIFWTIFWWLVAPAAPGDPIAPSVLSWRWISLSLPPLPTAIGGAKNARGSGRRRAPRDVGPNAACDPSSAPALSLYRQPNYRFAAGARLPVRQSPERKTAAEAGRQGSCFRRHGLCPPAALRVLLKYVRLSRERGSRLEPPPHREPSTRQWIPPRRTTKTFVAHRRIRPILHDGAFAHRSLLATQEAGEANRGSRHRWRGCRP